MGNMTVGTDRDSPAFLFSFVYREEPRDASPPSRLYFPLCIHGCKTAITRMGH
jgi:hypothetical protein